MGDDLTITRAALSDAPEVLALIKRAFAHAGELYADPDLPPLAETLAEHEARYERYVVLKAIDADGTIVGTVQGALVEGGACEVARLAVDPDRQGEGIGRALALAIEREFPVTERFELFTGHLNESSLALYESLGYREVGRRRESDRLTLVWLEKVRPRT